MKLHVAIYAIGLVLMLSSPNFSQTTRKKAEEYTSHNNRMIVENSGEQQGAAVNSPEVQGKIEALTEELEKLRKRLDLLEDTRPKIEGSDAALLTGLEIIAKGEDRVASLRKQISELADREQATREKLEQTEIELMPENLLRSLAFVGSLRPEEAREARRSSLEAVKAKLVSSLEETLEAEKVAKENLKKAEVLLERLRLRFEKQIEAGLDQPSKF
jgi:uncharacterized phage infection (PIP) family protein YhgE